MRTVRVVVLLLLSLPASAFAGRVLVPLSMDATDGAYGSLWFSYAYGLNTGPTPVAVKWPRCIVGVCQDEFVLEPGVDGPIPIDRVSPDIPLGVMLYVPDESDDVVTIKSRIQDLSRESLTWGTEIPVIRESGFLSRPAELLDVPLDSRFRVALRIYDPDLTDTVFDVNVYSLAGDLLASRSVVGMRAARSPQPRHAQTFQATNLAAFIPELPTSGEVRIEVSPHTSVKFWTFVSVTNNETQHVTIITP